MEAAQTILRDAAGVGDINGLYNSLQQVPNILDLIDEIPFVDSPLHVAASEGHANFAIEILSLKPSFGRKLNPGGLSPFHLALQNGHFEMVRRVIKFDKELIWVKGRERFTPFHYAVKLGNTDLLAEFLYACPESIKDLTVRGENALHIAVENNQQSALQVLLGYVHRTKNGWLLKSKDEMGNTVLHNAVATLQPQDANHSLMVKVLSVKKFLANKNEKNLDGKTALDITIGLQPGDAKTTIENILLGARASQSSSLAHHDDDCSIAHFLKSRESIFEICLRYIFLKQRSISVEMLNITLVVAVLIATATFQTALSPPGSVGGGSDNYLLSNGSLINSTISSANLPAPFSNVSHINATVFFPFDKPLDRIPIKDKHGNGEKYGPIFLSFYVLNTMAFLASLSAILSVLPFRGFEMLHLSLLFLMISYGVLFRIISPSAGYAAGFCNSTYTIAWLVYYGMTFHHVIQTFGSTDWHLTTLMSDKWNLTTLRSDKWKRIRMLQDLVINSSDYSALDLL